jgi:hypothetical protein
MKHFWKHSEMKSAQGQEATSMKTRSAPAPSSTREPDWKKEFLDLWTAVQGVRDCLDTWEEDKVWCNEHPNKAYPSTKSEGMGKKFQLFQFLSRLRHEDVDELVKAIRMIEEQKIVDRNQVSTKGKTA